MERTRATSNSLQASFEHGSHERSDQAAGAGRRFRGAFTTFWIPRLRPCAVAALLCVLYQVATPWQYAEAQPAVQRAGAGTAFAMPEIGERLDEAVRGTREALARLDAASGRALAGAAGLGEAAGRCETAFEALEGIDEEVLAGYERVGDHVRASGLGAEIRVRNDAAERAYRGRFQEVRRAVRETVRLARDEERARERGDREQAEARRTEVAAHAARTDDLLAAMVAPPERVPLDPENLPHRVIEREPRPPRLSPEEFGELSVAGVGEKEAALQATAPVLSFDAAAAPPAPEDLAETVEVQFTPEIEALAEELGGDPLAIFDFVHNEIEHTWTFGSIQGAGSCLLSRRCNAFDTASLLIALYRASGIPARYAMGTVEVPIEGLEGLVGGFTDARSALQLIASSGTPVTAVISEGELATARFEHVWVEAFLDYVPSRGARHVDGDTWVPLDPSFKRSRSIEPFDVLGALDFDSDALLTSIVDSAQIDDTAGVIEAIDVAAIDDGLAEVEAQIGALAEAPEAPAAARETFGGPEIETAQLPALPGAPPYRVLVRAGQFDEVPASLRHRLRLEIASGFLGLTSDLVYTAPLPTLAGKRITLSYVPATEADAATLTSFLPDGDDFSLADLPTSFPAYLIEMRPELKVEGEVVARGRAVTLGLTGRLRLGFSGPGARSRTIDNAITAGSYSALVLNLSRIEDPEPRLQQLQSVVDELESSDPPGVDRDEVFGEILHLAGTFYWLIVGLAERSAAGRQRVAFSRLPSEGIFAFGLRVESVFGAPLRVSPGGMITDVDANVRAVVPLDGDDQRRLDFMVASGAMGSRAESVIWDALFHGTPTGQGVDSMSYLAAAARRDIPVLSIDAENVATALPRLEVAGAVKRDVENAVNAGRVVTIPERAFELHGFSGVGYVALDPESGSGAYMITGAFAGGGFGFSKELEFAQGVLFNISLTLFPLAVPAIAEALVLLTIVSFILNFIITFLNAIVRVRLDDSLTSKEKAAIIMVAGLQAFLSSLFALAARRTNLSIAASIKIDLAASFTDQALKIALNFFIGPPPSSAAVGTASAGT